MNRGPARGVLTWVLLTCRTCTQAEYFGVVTGHAKVMAGLAVVVLAAGCSRTEKTLPADYNAVPVTKRTDYTPPTPSVQTGVLRMSALSTVRERVEMMLLPQIRKQVAIPVDCDRSPEPAGVQKTVTCHATWEGVRVPFGVKVGGSAGTFYQLEVRQLEGLILADAVRDAWASDNHDGPLSCDSSIPKATLVPLDKPTPYRCAAGTSVYTVRITSGNNTSHMWFESVRT
jgi:hypothetical protein